MVRDELGDNAIIVATREEKGGPSRGGAVRVTAAIDGAFDQAFDDGLYDRYDGYADDGFDDTDDDDDIFGAGPAFEPQTDTRSRSKRAWLQYDGEAEDAAIVEDITDALLRHGATEDVMDEILSCATVVGLETSGIALMAAIEHLFAFTPLPVAAHPKPIIMAGPPGSGKTLAVAKMAARGVVAGLRVGVISTDTVRAGGIEQLEAFTKLLRIDLQKAANLQDLAAIAGDLRGYDQILIDTPGANPFEKDDIKSLARMIGTLDAQAYLVMPGGMDAEESGEIARAFATLGVDAMIPTRVDIARRLGGLLSAASQGGLAFADASNTPKVADGLLPLDPKSLANLLMPGAFREAPPRIRPAQQQTGRA